MTTPSQLLQLLSTFYDRWQTANAEERVAIQREADEQGADFARAFAAMIAQAETGTAQTQLTPLSDAWRDAALSRRSEGGTNGNHPRVVSLESPPPPREAGNHVGPYRLIREIGRGGMGVVWLAARADGQHERQVALKMPLVENLNWLLAARFARERNILASLEHPGIARLYDAGVDSETQPYIALEYVVGVPINEYVRDQHLKPEATVALFTKVINAVSHAHAQLVIHRDIKPTNILVDAKGEPHLLDFGIAKLLDDEDSMSADATQLTRMSGRALTLDYAAPEQVNGQTLGTASDVYALGIVLYELLTGNKPYAPKGPTRRDLELAICEQEPAKPSDRLILTGTSEAGKTARRIRGDLDTVVLKALKKDPRQRYATAQAFADDLKRYLAFEPIAAKPDSEWYRIGKFVRRNRWAMAAVGAVVVALSVGVTSTLWQAERAERERREANVARDFAMKELTHAEAMSEFMSYLLTGAEEGDTAAQLLDRAQKQVETQYLGNPDVGVRIQLNIADMLVERGNYDRASSVLALAQKQRDQLTDRSIQARVDCQVANSDARTVGGPEPLAQMDRAIASLRGTTNGAEAATYCLLERAVLRRNRGDAVGSIADAQEALKVLDSRPSLRPTAILMRSLIADNKQLLGQSQEAIKLYELALTDLATMGRADTQAARITRTDMASAYSKAGQTLQAFRHFEAVAQATPANTQPSFSPLMVNYAKAMADIGRLEQSKRMFDTALVDANASKVSRAIGFTSLGAALTACAAQDPDHCERLLAAARGALATGLPANHSAFGTTKMIAGHVAWLRGNTEAARLAWSEANDHFASATDTKIGQIRALMWLSRAESALGKSAEANIHADAAVAMVRASLNGFRNSEWLGSALLAQAIVRKTDGAVANARLSLDEALTNLRETVGEEAVSYREAQKLSLSL
jgi:serine/threonine protein kinase